MRLNVFGATSRLSLGRLTSGCVLRCALFCEFGGALLRLFARRTTVGLFLSAPLEFRCARRVRLRDMPRRYLLVVLLVLLAKPNDSLARRSRCSEQTTAEHLGDSQR